MRETGPDRLIKLGIIAAGRHWALGATSDRTSKARSHLTLVGTLAHASVQAHSLECFLDYVFWKLRAQWTRRGGTRDSSLDVLDDRAQIQSVDSLFTTTDRPRLHVEADRPPPMFQGLGLEGTSRRWPRRLTEGAPVTGPLPDANRRKFSSA